MAAQPRSDQVRPEMCNALAIRQAARHVSQFYDQCMAPTGLRASQFSILARLKRLGPMTINRLAHDLVTDRTTMGRNILPLAREGLIEIRSGPADRRARELHLTAAGAARLGVASVRWEAAQARFEAVFGAARAAEMRRLMHDIAGSDLGPPA